MTQPLATSVLTALHDAVGREQVRTDAGDTMAYAFDNSAFRGQPQAVVWCTEHDQVEALLRVCAEHRLPVTARGRGTNTTGASVPIAGGIVLSLERMNRILDVSVADRAAVVEPGVLNGELRTALAERHLFWAPDPTSAPYCSIGGNLACNAGGPAAVKYGATREHVLALRAVDGLGRGFRTGTCTTKSSTGYDFTRLLIGSEGTLGIITEATLKLTPLPEARLGFSALYTSVDAAAEAIARLMAQPVTPCALEFMDDRALALVRSRGADIPAGNALLIVEVDGSASELPHALQAVVTAASGRGEIDGLVQIVQATSSEDREAIWQHRRALSPALKQVAPTKVNEDVVVPVSKIPILVAALQALSHKHDIPIVTFGHAGNGNLHVNLMFDKSLPEQAQAAEQCLAAVFEQVITLGGTLSGEHGIGLMKKSFMPQAVGEVGLNLMRGIKQAFDPHGILNPGKLF